MKELKPMKENIIKVIKSSLDFQFGCGDTVEVGDTQAAAEMVFEDLKKNCYKIEPAMTEREIATNKSHCCRIHGCKYGNENCPVVNGLVEQDYICQDCQEELENEEYYKRRLHDVEIIKLIKIRTEAKDD